MRLPILSVSVFLISIALLSCAQKKVVDKKFFPVASYLRSEIAKMDSTLSPIRKYVYIDSTHTDTLYIHRNDFRAVAKDFLDVPDLTKSEYQDRYTETSQFDETLNRVLIVCTPLKPEKEQLQRQELLIKPDGVNGQVTNMIFNTTLNTKDSSVEKHMLWKVDESFQVTTTRQYPGQPEKTTTYKVEWNDQ
jgi:hypothetical protein